MRILHIDTGREMRGGQWQVLQLVRGLHKRGIDSHLQARGPLLAAARDSGISCSEASATAVMRSWGYDLMHAHDARAHTWAAPAIGCPLIVARRVFFAVRRGVLSRWKYQQAARFIAISRAVRSELERAGIPSGKIDIVPDGVSVPESVIPYDQRPQLFLGLFKEPEEWAGLRDLQVQLSTDLADDLPKSRGLLYLSRSEGLGSSALWAMAHSVPVIASRTGGLVEVVEDEKTGFLVDNDNPEDIRGALRKLRADPELAARMGILGRQRVSKEFTIDRMVDRTIQIYGSVLHSAGRT